MKHEGVYNIQSTKIYGEITITEESDGYDM